VNLPTASLLELCARLGPRGHGGVPPWTYGCFRRRSITYFTGQSNTTTQVFWLQSRGLTADLRLPAGLPRIERLAQASPADLLALAECEGGLARTAWQPSAETALAGTMAWSDWTALQLHDKWPEPGRLCRVGDCLVEHAPSGAYVEDWRLQPSADGPLVGLHLLEERSLDGAVVHHRGGGLVICGDHAALVRGRPAPLPTALRLDDFVRAHLHDEGALAAAFACEASYGVRGPGGFTVTASTNPGRQGQALLDLDGFAYDQARDLVVQRSLREGVERLFSIDTLAAQVSFSPATPATPEAEAWLLREGRTLTPPDRGANPTHPPPELR
jgi:hypothetical protein